MNKPRIAFICVHNSCRSQIAEALARQMASEVLDIDIAVTMGCGVQCPNLPCRERYAWEIPDPTGMEDEAFLRSIAKIQKELQHLLQESLLLQEYRNEKR